jgi:hypothetical protein
MAASPPVLSRLATAPVLFLSVALTVGCQKAPQEISVPPPGAPPAVVLNAYLQSLVAGDCDTTHTLAAPSFTTGNGDLCGSAEVETFAPLGEPATPTDGEVIYATTLTTNGSADGSIAAGRLTWFYSLKQIDGEWRLVGGGSGP